MRPLFIIENTVWCVSLLEVLFEGFWVEVYTVEVGDRELVRGWFLGLGELVGGLDLVEFVDCFGFFKDVVFYGVMEVIWFDVEIL